MARRPDWETYLQGRWRKSKRKVKKTIQKVL